MNDDKQVTFGKNQGMSIVWIHPLKEEMQQIAIKTFKYKLTKQFSL